MRTTGNQVDDHGTAGDPWRRLSSWPHMCNATGPLWMYVGYRYDRACRRFGTPRINELVRNRILSNRARRVLQNAPRVLETVVA